MYDEDILGLLARCFVPRAASKQVYSFVRHVPSLETSSRTGTKTPCVNAKRLRGAWG